jgi:HAD superfamily hydrolase (TIGR01484 family)
VSGLLDLGETAPRIYLFPANATAMYMMGNGMWEPVYEERLGDPVKRRIFAAFARALKETGYEWPKDVYGEVIEDRGTQMTFSALGQLAPLEMKRRWDPDGRKRGEIMKRLARYLPDRVEARLGGTTSIDVTMRGIDKGYGIRKIMERLGYKKGEMLFIGNCLYKGGNDFPVIATGVRWMSVRGPQETKRILKRIIAESEGR